MLEAVEKSTERRGAMTETALQLADGVLRAVGEQGKDVRFSL